MLRRSEDDGQGPVEAHYRAMAKAQGINPKAYIEAHLGKLDLPEAFNYLWNVFADLANRRRFDGAFPEGIPFSEFNAYIQLTGKQLKPWEIQILTKLDDHYRETLHARAKKRQERN